MFGEPKLIAFSLVLTGISLALLPFLKGEGQLKWLAVLRFADWPWIKMLLVLALLAIGTGLTRPPVFGLLSNLAPANEQGATHRRRAKRRRPGAHPRPAVRRDALCVYPMLPYVICGGLAVLTGLLAWQFLCRKNLASAAAEKTQTAD